MRRKFVIAGLMLLAIAASTLRISYHKLGWDGYWAVDFALPWE
jgi:hypothetical protein